MNWMKVTVFGMLGLALCVTDAAAATCETLRTFSIRQGVIASTQLVPAGPYVPAPRAGGAGRGARAGAPAQPGAGAGQPGGAAPQAARAGGPPPAPAMLPEHCRVKMVLKPSADSNINAELWLPTTAWNGKFMAVGNGGFGGSIQGYGEMANALARGYATAGNDTGHSDADGPGGMFGLGHPEKIVDFAYRAMHEMTAQSKKIIDELYGRPPQLSYYKGCSTGGRQGVMAAQRYPEDFDGIIAGALANRHIHQHTAGVYRSIELSRHPEGAIPATKAQAVNTALMNACDTLKEGFLNNPRACTFDFRKLACAPGADDASCLTAAQLKTVETFYGGLKNSKGELIFSGQALGNPLPALRSTNGTPGGGYDTVRIWGFQNADYDWRTFNLDRDMPLIDRKVGFVDAVNPNLGDFKKRGGKLLLYAGWGDTTITPENTVLYYESVLKEMGRGQDNWMRLFMVPGMGHCGGGSGPNTFDSIGALEQWREKGVAPAQMMGSNRASGLTRPICAYPQYARYKGSGDLKDASNWAGSAP
jgi:feruloyl esterase